jgi:hypothetical protein
MSNKSLLGNFVFKILNKNKSLLDESVAMEKNKINKAL